MPNIRVDLDHELIDGQPVTFAAPCNCTEITGLKVYCPDGSHVFTFTDAHGNTLTGLGNLFSKGAYVKAILDTTSGNAYLQNADTNAYLEAQFASKATTPLVATGDSITVNDSSDLPLHGLKLYGKTTQNGTPSPDAPAALVNAGASGEIGVTIAGDNLYYYENLSFTRQTYYTPTRPLPPGTYTLSALVTSTDTDSTTSAATFLDENNNNIGSVLLSRDVRSSGTVTIGKYCSRIRFYASTTFANGNGDACTWADIMLNRGNAALPYKPKYVKVLVASTPNGLPGVPQTNSSYYANYTDSNGQRWVCDEIDFERGVYVQRIVEKVLDGTESWKSSGGNTPYFTSGLGEYGSVIGGAALATHLQYEPINSSSANIGITVGSSSAQNRAQVQVRTSTAITTVAACTEWFKANPTTILYALAEPIETPLSAEELAQYAALHSNKPNTTIYNDGVAGMEVSYYTPNAAVPMNLGAGASGKVLSVDEHGCVIPKTLEQIGAAPVGYGLGGPSTEIRNCDLDDIVENGWYSYNMNAEVANVPMDIASMLFVENFYDTNFCKQTVTFLDGINTTVTRVRQSGSWREWEYENPPMTPGVEYRTTERCNGKAVYTKLIDMGTYTSGVMRVAHNCGDITPIRCYGVQGNVTIPMHQCDSEDGREYDWIVGLRADQTSVEVSSHTESPNGVNVTAQIWYVKN